MPFSLFPPWFPEPNSKFQQTLFSAAVGFFNGWIIAALVGLTSVLIVAKGHFTFNDLWTIVGLGIILGGLFALFFFPPFYLLFLGRIEFWRMWRVAFPLTYLLTTAGFIGLEFPGGYAASLAALGLTSWWFHRQTA